METNYKHYFGTPERASKMTIERWDDEEAMKDGITVLQGDELIVSLCRQDGDSLESWLEKDCGIRKEPVSLSLDASDVTVMEIGNIDGKLKFNLEFEIPLEDDSFTLMEMWPLIRIEGEIDARES